MKALLTEEDIKLHVCFTEGYRIGHQDTTHGVYSGNQSFSIPTACCYTKSDRPDDLQNDRVIVVTESSDHS